MNSLHHVASSHVTVFTKRLGYEWSYSILISNISVWYSYIFSAHASIHSFRVRNFCCISFRSHWLVSPVRLIELSCPAICLSSIFFLNFVTMISVQISGVSPALRTSFKGDALCTKAAGRMTGPVAKAEAWVRVVPANSVAAGKQADALVAGTRELFHCLSFRHLFGFVT